MCDLFALCAAHSHCAAASLPLFAARGRRNVHGWGIGFFRQRQPVVEKSWERVFRTGGCMPPSSAWPGWWPAPSSWPTSATAPAARWTSATPTPSPWTSGGSPGSSPTTARRGPSSLIGAATSLPWRPAAIRLAPLNFCGIILPTPPPAASTSLSCRFSRRP